MPPQIMIQTGILHQQLPSQLQLQSQQIGRPVHFSPPHIEHHNQYKFTSPHLPVQVIQQSKPRTPINQN